MALLLACAQHAVAEEGVATKETNASSPPRVSDEFRRGKPGDGASGHGPVKIDHIMRVADAADHGPVAVVNPGDYIIPPGEDPFAFLQDGTDFISSLAKKMNLSFVPQMVYTYQHATKSNGPHGFSHIYTNINGAMPFLAKEGNPVGHLLYNVQGNSGVGTQSFPFINEYLGSPFFLNDVLTMSRLSLKKLWWRQDLVDKKFTINVGKLYYANFFDMNAAAEDPTRQFLAAQLTNNTAVPYPSYGFGAVGEWRINDESLVCFGSMNARASGVSSGFENLDEGRFFNMAQYSWTPKLHVDGNDRQGHYRGFVWYSNDDIDYSEKGWGLGVSFDQDVGGGVTPFIRWGWAQEGAAPASMCWSAGATLNGVFERAHDGIGVAFCFSKIDDYTQDFFGTGQAGGDWETIIEAFWRIQVTETLQISPDIQWFQSGESGGVSNTWIWGLRCTWNF